MTQTNRKRLCLIEFVCLIVFLALANSITYIDAQEFTAPVANWKIIAGGIIGSLNITETGFHHATGSPGKLGKDIGGALRLGEGNVMNIMGFYNDNMNRIIFQTLNSSDKSQSLIFTGYLISGSLTAPDSSCARVGGFYNMNTLVGSFEVLSGASALDNARGWYAEYGYCQFP